MESFGETVEHFENKDLKKEPSQTNIHIQDIWRNEFSVDISKQNIDQKSHEEDFSDEINVKINTEDIFGDDIGCNINTHVENISVDDITTKESSETLFEDNVNNEFNSDEALKNIEYEIDKEFEDEKENIIQLKQLLKVPFFSSVLYLEFVLFD